MISIACDLAIDTEAAGVSHIPVTSATQGVDVIITARSPGQDVVANGRLFFRQINEREYVSQPMLRSGDDFEGRILSKHVAGIGIEYYIVLYLSGGTTITSPEQDPMFLPHVIVIVPAEQEWFEVLYPEMNSVIEDRMPQISAAFSSHIAIVQDNVQIKLDGSDITRHCEITQDFFLYVPSKELNPGTHIVTVVDLGSPEMAGSWQFSIAGTPALWRQLSGGASVTWQWAHANSDSPFLIHSQGSNLGLAVQIAGQALGRSFDAWLNKSTLYTSETTDFGLGFYGNRVRITAGDLFPSISKLTLDGMPARGGEADIKPLDRVAVYFIGAEGRLFTDTEDEFTAGLLNSRFGGFRVAAWPVKKKWQISSLYIHASNRVKSGPNMPFSMEKKNDILSLKTELYLPAEFSFYGEWVRSDHLTRYGEEFASELYKDKGISVGLGKRIRSLALELFYLDIGDEFFSEVNPFVENGRNGFGFSGRYSHSVGISMRGEYGRYRRESNLGSPSAREKKETEYDTELRTNVNLSFSKLPSIFAVYYQQRVPYAKYDVRGVSMGVSYRFWRLSFFANGSRSATNLWTDGIKRRSISASATMEYQVVEDTNLRMDYSEFGSYRSGNMLRRQRRISVGARRRIRRNHLLSVDLKAVKFTDKEDTENDYSEKVLIFKYGYSF